MSKMFTLVCCNFSKSQGGKIQTPLELSYHSHLKKEGMTVAIAGHRRRGGCSKPYSLETRARQQKFRSTPRSPLLLYGLPIKFVYAVKLKKYAVNFEDSLLGDPIQRKLTFLPSLL